MACRPGGRLAASLTQLYISAKNPDALSQCTYVAHTQYDNYHDTSRPMFAWKLKASSTNHCLANVHAQTQTRLKTQDLHPSKPAQLKRNEASQVAVECAVLLLLSACAGPLVRAESVGSENGSLHRLAWAAAETRLRKSRWELSLSLSLSISLSRFPMHSALRSRALTSRHPRAATLLSLRDASAWRAIHKIGKPLKLAATPQDRHVTQKASDVGRKSPRDCTNHRGWSAATKTPPDTHDKATSKMPLGRVRRVRRCDDHKRMATRVQRLKAEACA